VKLCVAHQIFRCAVSLGIPSGTLLAISLPLYGANRRQTGKLSGGMQNGWWWLCYWFLGINNSEVLGYGRKNRKKVSSKIIWGVKQRGKQFGKKSGLADIRKPDDDLGNK